MQQYNIVKLYKAKYNTDKWDVSKRGTPRLLVVNVNKYNNILKVKYPNGYIQTVTMDDIYPRTVFNKDHINYAKLLVEMPAARTQLQKSSAFADYLKRECPSALVELSQQLAARTQSYALRLPKPPTETTPPEPPVVTAPDTSLETDIMLELKAINDKLTTLIAIWGGPNYG